MAQEQQNMQNDDLGEKLNAMLSDPESLSRLAGMASALASSGVLSGLMGNPKAGGGETASDDTKAPSMSEDNRPSDTLPAETQKSLKNGIRAVNGRDSALLRALKPYLGQEKQARIDQMMRLLQLAELADTVLRGK
ncbi:MAG: hypothetical protein IKV66_00205 [Clostridia bacterium]|nr:hypothetical protein [Clostridia bacterium]